MTKKYLQGQYNQGNITYSEKENLNKIGVSDYSFTIYKSKTKTLTWKLSKKSFKKE